MREEVRADAEVGRLIYQLRTEAGLSQQELARRVGATQSVISGLEDADYEGPSLAMPRRVAQALGHRVVVTFVPAREAATEVTAINPDRHSPGGFAASAGQTPPVPQAGGGES